MSSKSRIAEIFEVLSKGQFISSNAVEDNKRFLYQYIEESFEVLSTKYAEIGYQLESGNNYYYFSKNHESNQSVEGKIEKALRWLDILAFFTTFRKDLCRGARFAPHDILPQIDINIALKEQLKELQKRNSQSKSYQDMLTDLLKELQKEGFIDLENEIEQTWKILDAWDYIEQMVMAVSIHDKEDEGKIEEIKNQNN